MMELLGTDRIDKKNIVDRTNTGSFVEDKLVE